MSALILIPKNLDEATYPQTRIYSADSLLGTYTLIDTVGQMPEYLDEAGCSTTTYEVAFTDGVTETDRISVPQSELKLISQIRSLLSISETELDHNTITAILPVIQEEVINDISKFVFSEVLNEIDDKLYYRLPDRQLMDINFGGAVSDLDIELYKQETPVKEYTTKIPVSIDKIDVNERYIKLSSALEAGYELSIDYYYTSRRIPIDLLISLLTYKFGEIYFQQKYDAIAAGTTGTDVVASEGFDKIKIGDITINKSSTSSTSTSTSSASALKDSYLKSKARYDRLAQRFRPGFMRVK